MRGHREGPERHRGDQLDADMPQGYARALTPVREADPRGRLTASSSVNSLGEGAASHG